MAGSKIKPTKSADKTPPTVVPANSTSDSSSEGSESESEPEPEPGQTVPANSEGSGSEYESESEPEPDKTSKPDPENLPVTDQTIKPTSAASESESESQSENDSESESDPENVAVPEQTIKPPPVSSDPMVGTSTGKRPLAELDDGGNAKRLKKQTVLAMAAPNAAAAGKKQKQLFQRLWSEENEIELIHGMIDFVRQKSKDPLSDVIQFYEFVKPSLRIDVSINQLKVKSRRLKQKFLNNVAKVRTLSNPHENKMYQLSKTLWGGTAANNNVATKKVANNNVATNGSSKTSSKTVGNESDPKLMFGNELTEEEFMMSKGLEMLSGSDKVKMEKKWKDLKVHELEHIITKAELMKTQAQLMLKAIKKSS